MLSIFNGLRDITSVSVAVRMALAFLCGAIIGLERSFKNRPAGFRTHILVCVAACIAAMTGLYIYLNLGLTADISRIGAQVVSGLGFIGAGTIIVTKNRTVKGLTTAAGLWTADIIGLAIGFGFYEGGIIATILVLITMTYFAGAVNGFKRAAEFRVRLHYHNKPALDQTLRYFKNHKMAILNLQVTSTNDSEYSEYSAVIDLLPRKQVHQEMILAGVRGISGVSDVEVV